MTVWVIRAGSPSRNAEIIDELEGYALDEGILSINYSFTRSVRDFNDITELHEYVLEDPRRIWRPRSYALLWRFANEVQCGDIVLLPIHAYRSGNVAVGRVVSDYDFSTDIGSDDYSVGPHFRNVDWLALDVPRENFDQEMARRLDLPPTVNRVTLEDAENRIQRIVDEHLEQN